MIILADTHLYITGERNSLPQCPNLTLHPDILRIDWPYMILSIIPTSLARTQKTYFTHIGSKKTGLKQASQLITKIWKLIHGQWTQHSKLKHVREALEDHAKELILDAKITYEHKRCQDSLTYFYNPYFGTPLSIILDTSITAR